MVSDGEKAAAAEQAKMAGEDAPVVEAVAVPMGDSEVGELDEVQMSLDEVQMSKDAPEGVAAGSTSPEAAQMGEQPLTLGTKDDVPQFGPASPEAEKRAVDASTKAFRIEAEQSNGVPDWCLRAGVGVPVSNKEDLVAILNKGMFARVAQGLFLLISWALSASVTSQLGSLPVVEGVTFPAPAPLSWGLACGIIAWFFSSCHAICTFLSLGPRNNLGITKFVVYGGIAGDLVFVFMSMSAFTALAVAADAFSTASSDFPSTFGSEIAGKTGAAAAFMFFSWMTFLHSCLISLSVYKYKGYLIAAFSPLAQLQQQQQPVDPVIAQV